jgi:hypothetical protein
VHGAALPRAGQHPGDGVLDAFVLITDGQAHPGEPALLQRPQELDPEAARLDLADIQADHFAQPGLVHGIGHHQRLGHDAAVIADLDVLSVQPQIRIRPLQGSLAKQLDLLIQAPAHR